MKKFNKIILATILSSLSFSSFCCINSNYTKVDAWSPNSDGNILTGSYIYDLCAFQSWYSNDIEDTINSTEGYSANSNSVVTGLVNGSSSTSRKLYDLNKGCGISTDDICLAYKRTSDRSKAITYIYGEINSTGAYSKTTYKSINGYLAEFNVVGGFNIDNENTYVEAQDFNATAGGSFVYLYVSTDSRIGCPIKNLTFEVFDETANQHETYLSNYHWVKTETEIDCNMNDGTSGDPIYLQYVTDEDYKYNLHYNFNGTVRDDENNKIIYSALPSSLLDLTDEVGTEAIFDGWYFDSEYQYQAKSGDTIDLSYVNVDTSNPANIIRSVTLYGRSLTGPADVKFVVDGEIYKEETNITNLPSTLPIPTKDGYMFEGWYYDASFTKRANNNDKVAGNITLYANFVEGQCISDLYLILDNFAYPVLDSVKQSKLSISSSSFRYENATADFYTAYFGMRYTSNTKDAIRDLKLLSEDIVNGISSNSKKYTDPDTNIEYYPVSIIMSEPFDFCPINSEYDPEGNYNETTIKPFKYYYLYATKDEKAGMPIKTISCESRNANSLDISIVGVNDEFFKKIWFERFTSLYTASIFSNPTTLSIIFVSVIILIGAGIAGFLYLKRKEKQLKKF